MKNVFPSFSGGPAIVEPWVGFLRPVALRPHLSVSLPFSVASTFVSLYVSPVSGNVPTGETAERRGLSGVFGTGGCLWLDSALGGGVRVRFFGNPAVVGPCPLDRWLCVPVFRRVCPCQWG